MQNINWVIQSNLTRLDTLQVIESALQSDDISYEEITIIPFSDELPQIKNPNANNFFYGTSTLIQNVYNNTELSTGVFYDSKHFNAENYIQRWGFKMLNHESEVMTFGEIIKREYKLEDTLFVRPVNDDKSFTGKVMTFSEIKSLADELENSNNPYLDNTTLILVSAPKLIQKEWRHFIVDKKIISSCRYLQDGKLNISAEDIPNELLGFVSQNCLEYTPHDIFVMDTALYNDEYYIVECNCFNDSGFYDHDIRSIFRSINKFLKTKSF